MSSDHTVDDPLDGPADTEHDGDLRRTVRAILDRLDRLETRLAGESEKRSRADDAAGDIDHGDHLWALRGVRGRRADDPSTMNGIVLMAGSLRLPTGTPIEWQQGSASDDLLGVDWSDNATQFAALAHPVRLELLRHILGGMHATAELTALDTLGTTGQLHHHLRQLLTSGWLKHRSRGSYEVPLTRVVPLLICLTGVADGAGGDVGGPAPDAMESS